EVGIIFVEIVGIRLCCPYPPFYQQFRFLLKFSSQFNRTLNSSIQSPLQILFDGCLNIIVQSLIQIVLISAMGAIIWFGVPSELPSAFMVGLFLAAFIGFLGQGITSNFKKISNLRKTIAGSPAAILKKAEGNSHYVAAKPPRPAFDIVLNDSIEIIWRFLLVIGLFYLLTVSIFVAYTYISEGNIRLPLDWMVGT
ncbi:MAG: hypothetical protein AB1801_22695, partial [Chloroflexota bacterium]